MNRRTFVKSLTFIGSALIIPSRLIADYFDEERQSVTLYDTYAQALYMDGSMGPKTGVIKVDYILENKEILLQFWHGHGGVQHTFTLIPEHYKELKKLKRVYIETSVVAGHTHKLFIEPKDPKWRVPGAPPVDVPVDDRIDYLIYDE